MCMDEKQLLKTVYTVLLNILSIMLSLMRSWPTWLVAFQITIGKCPLASTFIFKALMCEAYNTPQSDCVWHYHECQSPCPATCQHKYLQNSDHHCSLSFACVEGCFPVCPEGESKIVHRATACSYVLESYLFNCFDASRPMSTVAVSPKMPSLWYTVRWAWITVSNYVFSSYSEE